MSYVKGILKEELKRLKDLFKKYESEISLLPRGSISIKKRNRKEYLYLAYREKGKVKFKYVGPAESKNSKSIIKKIKKRKQFEEKFKQVKKDLKEVERIIQKPSQKRI